VSSPELFLALNLSTRVAAVGVALSGLELLALAPQWRPAGTFSARTVAALHSRPVALDVFDRWLKPLLLLQIGGSLALVALGPYALAGRLALVLAFGATLAVRWRRKLAGDGAEQMSAIILAAACLATLPAVGGGRVELAVIFLAAELCLAYTTSGVAKLISPIWRSGEALPAILSTNSHGHRNAAAFFHRFPALAFCASWGVILFECLFPLALLGPGWLLAAALLIGLSFHLANAVLMGLNSFVWAFPAVYPCVVALWWVYIR